MVNRTKSFIRRPTGNQFCGEEYFNGTGSSGQSLTLGHIPFRELDLVEYHDGNDWVMLSRGTGTTDYALAGSEDMEDRYIWMGSGITVPATDTGNIHVSYRIKSLTVNTEMTLTVGQIVTNVETSYSDSGNIAKKGLVDSNRHPQVDVLTNNITSVNGVTQGGSDWTEVFFNLTVDTGNMSVYTGLISNYTEGISLSLDNISAYTEGISVSLDNISLVQLPSATTTLGNFKVSIEESPIVLGADVNITGVAGTVQTAGDWTTIFNTISTDMSNLRYVQIPTTTTTAGSLKVAVMESISAGDAIIGQVKVTDGTTIAGVDAGTNAILVKEVSGAMEIADVNLTSVSGTVQTAGDWTVNFNTIQNNTELISNSVGFLPSINDRLQNISDSVGTVNGKIVSCDTGFVSIIDSVLPTGAATEITVQNISNSVGFIPSIDSKINACDTGAVIVSTNVYPANASSWETGQVTVPNVGTVVQLPDITIPNGFRGVIKAKKANVGTISVGNTAIKALSTSTGHFKLEANESLSLMISNLNLVFIDGWFDNEGVEYATEANP